MTDDKIDSMPAGYELDGAVAENVMGWTIDKNYPDYGFPPEEALKWAGSAKKIPPYSADLLMAWKLLNVLALNYSISISSHDGGKTWQCILEKRDNKMRFPDAYASAKTLSLAICRAALKTRKFA